MTDQTMPSRRANMEKAEGDRASAQESTPAQPQGTGHAGEDTGGITNRPLSEEDENQAAVPERGHTKEEETSDAETPRRYDEPAEDAALPASDSTLNTKI